MARAEKNKLNKKGFRGLGAPAPPPQKAGDPWGTRMTQLVDDAGAGSSGSSSGSSSGYGHEAVHPQHPRARGLSTRQGECGQWGGGQKVTVNYRPCMGGCTTPVPTDVCVGGRYCSPYRCQCVGGHIYMPYRWGEGAGYRQGGMGGAHLHSLQVCLSVGGGTTTDRSSPYR